jgi:5-methylcytosine-specific restriction endonuclease McrA
MTADNITTETQVCSKCLIEKPLTDFYKRNNARGVRRDCKRCAIARVSDHAKLNRDKKLVYLKDWRQKNIEAVREIDRVRSREYREKFPERRKVINKKYRENNKEKVAESGKRWKQANPEAVRLMKQRRRCRKGAEVLSKGIIRKLYKLQKGKCPCCNQKLGDDFHLDHVIPLALGGENTDRNIQLLRGICNLRKSAKHPVDYMQSKGFLL